MRLALIGPTYPFKGGIAHHTTLLADALRQEGHEVLFISYTRQYPAILYGRSDRDPSQNRLETDVTYLIDSINPLTWIKAGRRIVQYKADFLILPWWVPFWAPLYLFLTSWISMRNPAIKTAFVCHNVLPHESGQLKEWITKATLSRGGYFMVQSTSERERLRKLLPAANVKVAPHPTYGPLISSQGQTDAEQIDVDALFAQKPHRALFCGIIRHYKGLDILIEAIRLLKENPAIDDQFHLLVAGEFWEDLSQFKSLIASYQLEHLITLEDRYLPNETLATYLKEADVVILPYRSATQSGIIQAALAAGTPVIGTQVGGISEEIIDGKNGLLVQPEDPAGLAEAISQFFTHKLQLNLTPNQAQPGRSDKHSWAYFAQTLTALLKT